MSSGWKVVIVLIGAILSLSVHATDLELPDWLGGKPDVVMQPDRCGVYEWFFNEADEQTEGEASGDDLASQRVINIVNKLIDYHQVDPQEEYSGSVRYLVFSEPQPFHFTFRISHEELERNLNKDCDE